MAKSRPVENEKVVRDTFSMPAAEHALLKSLRSKAARQGHIYTKSELVRAGLLLLSSAPIHSLLKALAEVSRVKPGRKPTDPQS